MAAQLFTQFPNATSNLIRALIVNSAILPNEIPSFLRQSKNKDTKQLSKQLQIYGYGQPDLFRAKYSAENYVVLLEDDRQIPVGSFQIYEIPPLPDEYLKSTGDRTLSITLAFDPPTRPTRGDSYLGVVMEFDLFKNLDKENIIQVFVKAKEGTLTEEFTELSKDELKKKYGSGVCVDLFPGANLRKKGSLQRGQISISSRSVGYGEKPLYLVITCSRKWAKQGEIDTQRYALVVSMNHSNPEMDLYNQLKLRTQIAQRIRIR